MKTIPENNMGLPLDIPEYVTLCPECGSGLQIDDIVEWDSVTGEITECGFYTFCLGELDIDIDHRYWQSDWQPANDKIYKWLSDNYRVGEVKTHTINGEQLSDAFDVWIR